MTMNRPGCVRALPADLVLAYGAHESPEAGMCVMEAVAYVAGEEHTDSPECACPVIAAFMRRWNDAIMDDARRTELLAPLVPRLVGSRCTAAVEQRRADLALDWLIRVQTPAWLELSDTLRPYAAALRGLVPLTSAAACESAQITLDEARSAWAATAGYHSAAAWDAVWDAAWAAAWGAAWDAAKAATSGPPSTVSSASAAAKAAAWGAAWAAAKAAAWEATRAASTEALQPTVAALQSSALVLVDRMLAVTDETTEAEFAALADWPVLVNGEDV